MEAGLEALLRQLGDAGKHHSDGRFTVDRERSKKLLASYRLAKPESYILNLIAAVVASGASSLSIRCSSAEILLEFDGRPFVVEELEGASSSLFLNERSPSVIRLQELAIGLQGARSFGYEEIDVHSGALGGRGIILELRPQGQTLRPFEREASEDQTPQRIRLRRRGAWQWLRSRISQAEPPEAELIRTRCSLAPLDIRLNGHPIRQQLGGRLSAPAGGTLACSWGDALPPESALYLKRLSHPEIERGFVCFRLKSESDSTQLAGGLTIVVNGVSFGLASEAWGVLHCPGLRKDLSQALLLEADVGFLQPLLSECLADLVESLAREFDGRNEAQRSFLLLWRVAPAHLQSFPIPPERQASLDEAFTAAPIYPLVGGGSASFVHLMRVESRPHRHVLFSPKPWERGCLDGAPVVLTQDSLVYEALKFEMARLGPRRRQLLDAEKLLREAHDAEMRRLRWLQQPPQSVQFEPHLEVWFKIPFASPGEPGWHGEVGLLRGVVPGFPLVRFFLEGRLLERRVYSENRWPEALLVAVEHPELRADPNWERVVMDEGLEASFQRLMEHCLTELSRLALSLWSNGQRAEELQRLLLSSIASAWEVEGARAIPIYPLAVPRWLYDGIEAPPGAPPEQLWDEQHASWDELQEQFLELKFLPVSGRSFPAPPAGGQLVALANPWLHRRLQQAFSHLEDFEVELRQTERRARSRQRWWSLPETVTALRDEVPVLARVKLETQLEAPPPTALPGAKSSGSRERAPLRIEGEVGAREGTGFSVTLVDFYAHARSLGHRKFNCDGTDPAGVRILAGLSVALRCDQLEPDDTFSYVPDSPLLNSALAAVGGSLPALTRALAALFPGEGKRRIQLQYQLFNCLSGCWCNPGQLLAGEPESPPLAETLCLDPVEGGLGLLCEVPERLRQTGYIKVICQLERPEPIAGLEWMLWLHPEVLPAFERWVGPQRCLSGEVDYLQALFEREQLARPVEEATLSAPVWYKDLDLPCGRGQIGLVRDSTIPHFHFRLRLLHQGRFLEEMVLSEWPTPPQRGWGTGALRISVVLDCPQAGPVLTSRSVTEIHGWLASSLRLLGFDWPLQQDPQPDLLDYLWGRLAAESYSSPGELEPTGFGIFGEDDVRAELRHIKLFPTAQGDWRSLDELLQELGEEGRLLYWVGQPPDEPPRDTVVLTHRDRIPVLRAIFGSQRTADASGMMMARLRAQEFQRQDRQASLELTGSYLWIEQLKDGPLQGCVGVRESPRGSSTLRFFVERRLVHTLTLQLELAVEANLEGDLVRPNRDWNGIQRSSELDEQIERAVQRCYHSLRARLEESQGSEHETVRNYLLLLAVRDRHSERAFVELWSAPLLRDPWGQTFSLNQLRSQFSDLKLFYWPALKVAPEGGPEVVPEGWLLPQLGDDELTALEAHFVSHEIYSGGEGARKLLEQLPVAEPSATARPEELVQHAPNGWLISYLDSDVRSLEMHWKGRRLPMLRRTGWPGYRAYLRVDHLPLTPQGALDPRHYLPALQEFELQLDSLWLKHLEEHPLSVDLARQAKPFLRGFHPLLRKVHEALPQAAQIYVPQVRAQEGQESLAERLRLALTSIAGCQAVGVTFSDEIERGVWYGEWEDASVRYCLCHRHPEWHLWSRRSLTVMVVELWLAMGDSRRREERHLHHQVLLDWLLANS